MTDLERAAKAAFNALQERREATGIMLGQTWDAQPEFVRRDWVEYFAAGLKEIRDPSEAATEIGHNLHSIEDWENRPWDDCINELFKAMIDHILNQKA